MSRSGVRTAAATFLTGTTGVAAVHRAPPSKTASDAWFASTSGHGAIGYLHIEGEAEARRAIGGASSGKKRVVYRIACMLAFRSTDTTDAETAQDQLDAIIEAVKAKIRSDRTLGSAAILQAGEGDTLNGLDLDVTQDILRSNGRAFWGWAVIRFVAIEWLTT